MTRDPAILKLLVGVSVLVIDTDPDARELLEAVLGYCGAFVAHAASAREALDIVAKEKPDVVVAETAMPDADGYWLVERLRARGAGRAIPVVALISGREQSADRPPLAVFAGHLRKPIDPWELCRMLAGLTRKP